LAHTQQHTRDHVLRKYEVPYHQNSTISRWTCSSRIFIYYSLILTWFDIRFPRTENWTCKSWITRSGAGESIRRLGPTFHEHAFGWFIIYRARSSFESSKTALGAGTIDYRCEDVSFPMSASCMTILNPDLLSSSETGINPGIRSWKKHLSEWARCQKAVGGIYFTKKWRAETPQPGLEFDNFKPRLRSGIFKCISWLNSLFLGAMNGVFWKRESRTN
jgi:hypothetical protein